MDDTKMKACGWPVIKGTDSKVDVNLGVIDVLEAALRDARMGDIQGIVLVSLGANHHIGGGFTFVGASEGATLMGGMEMVKVDMLRAIEKASEDGENED